MLFLRLALALLLDHLVELLGVELVVLVEQEHLFLLGCGWFVSGFAFFCGGRRGGGGIYFF